MFDVSPILLKDLNNALVFAHYILLEDHVIICSEECVRSNEFLMSWYHCQEDLLLILCRAVDNF